VPCDTRLKPRQTISQRAAEIREAIARLSQAMAAGRVKVKVGSQGAVALEGWDTTSRDGITDACAIRQIMKHGSATAKMAIERAEQLAGRKIDKQVLGVGVHSHDGGQTWHDHK
jgi:hypothetical protein